jgi:hypothetical protein
VPKNQQPKEITVRNQAKNADTAKRVQPAARRRVTGPEPRERVNVHRSNIISDERMQDKFRDSVQRRVQGRCDEVHKVTTDDIDG